METKYQTSFIPKRPVINSGDDSLKVRQPVNLIGLIATIVFVLSLLAAGALFGYSRYLTQRIDSMGQELAAAQASLPTDRINQFMRLDGRIASARVLLSRHVAISRFFDMLQNSTVRDVQFTDFNLLTDDGGAISAALKGAARSYNALALQSERLGQNQLLNGQIFSDIDLNERGEVLFSYRTSISPNFVLQQNSFKEESSAFQPQQSAAN